MRLAPFAAAAVLVASASTALAQSRMPRNDWRQQDRTEARYGKYASPQWFTLEMRWGPYNPEVDDEFDGKATPFKDIFGDSAQVYFGLELDFLPVRIPWVGALGPGFGWGYTRNTGKAMAKGSCQAGSCTAVEQETHLTIFPMHLSAVLRADEIMRRTGVPIVPYGKLGLGLGLWTSSTDAGVSDAVSCSSTGTCAEVIGRDTTWGFHMALGASLALNFLEPRAAAQMDETTGVNHVYIFGEWMNARLDGIGSRPQMHIGTSTWVLGLSADM